MSEIENSNLEDLELRSEDVQEILTKVPHWMIRWGNILFLSLIVLLLMISWFVKYPDIIPAETIVTTEIPPQKEFAMITGKLDTILVKDAEIVDEKSPLAIVENSADYNDIFRLKSVIDTIVFNKKNLYFPINDLPVMFLGEVEGPYADFENNYIQYFLNKELQPFLNEASANRFSVSQLNRQLSSLISQRELNQTQLKFKKKDIERNKILFDKGVISEQEYEVKQLEYLQEQRNLKNISMSIFQMRESLNNAKRNSKGTEINKIKEEMILVKRLLQSYNNLKKSLKDWELKYLFESEIKGKVSFFNVWSSNQTVNQGDLVFTIIPTEYSEYIAKLKTPSRNSGKIKIGQKVNIKLENYPDYEFGILIGEVKNVSLIPDKNGAYFIDVSLPQKLVTSYNKEIKFNHEMRGVAEIVTSDLRLIERFFYQFREILSRK